MARSTIYNKITSPEKLSKVNIKNKELGEEWLSYLGSLDRTKSTINGYRNDLNIFWCWNLEFNNNKDFLKLKKRDIARFQNHAINVWNWSPKRTRRVKACLSSLSNYIEDMSDEDDEFEDFKSVVKKIENPQNIAIRKKTVMLENQIEKLLNTLVENKEYEKACSIAIGAYSGMRKSEIIQMKESFFSDENIIFDGAMWETPEIRTKGKGKYGKPLKKYVLIKAKPYVELWINRRHELGVDIDDLFVTKFIDENKNVCWRRRRSFDDWTNQFSEIVGESFYYHAMRHFTCTELFRNNIPSSVIQEFFGWSSSEMLNIYNDITGKSEFGKYFTKDGITKIEVGNLSNV